jgi:hypothetical protein
VEVKAEPGRHQRGWRKDHGGRAGHGGGEGVAPPDLVEKEANQIWQRRRMAMGGQRWRRRMVLGSGVADVVRMFWERQRGEQVSINESV